MTELVQPTQGAKVLEVGTGSGYQAAILAETGAEVYSIEIIGPLAKESAERLKRLGYDKVHVKQGDGYLGWPERAPFDAIIVTAGANHVPPPLVEQLKPGGRMVIPVGESHGEQSLLLVHKSTDGKVTTRNAGPVLFVPLTREPAK
jgi:protein-L-isoaspartate(D-aspartate) O-methyltransferase